MRTKLPCWAALAAFAASGASAAPAVAPVPPATHPAPATAATSAKAASSPAVFPAKVNAKYASQSAGQARMHTCLDQYNANKTAHANGGLGWIQKGGGYYSLCTKKLKG